MRSSTEAGSAGPIRPTCLSHILSQCNGQFTRWDSAVALISTTASQQTAGKYAGFRAHTEHRIQGWMHVHIGLRIVGLRKAAACRMGRGKLSLSGLMIPGRASQVGRIKLARLMRTGTPFSWPSWKRTGGKPSASRGSATPRSLRTPPRADLRVEV